MKQECAPGVAAAARTYPHRSWLADRIMTGRPVGATLVVALILALALSAPASADLSKKQVRRIANAVFTARAAQLRGFVYAHISADGRVDPSRSNGISQNNVVLTGNPSYCFLDPLPGHGAQVTVDGAEIQAAGATAQIYDQGPGVGQCSFYVIVLNRQGALITGGFYITVY